MAFGIAHFSFFFHTSKMHSRLTAIGTGRMKEFHSCESPILHSRSPSNWTLASISSISWMHFSYDEEQRKKAMKWTAVAARPTSWRSYLTCDENLCKIFFCWICFANMLQLFIYSKPQTCVQPRACLPWLTAYQLCEYSNLIIFGGHYCVDV